jgi:hypothetical protein
MECKPLKRDQAASGNKKGGTSLPRLWLLANLLRVLLIS